MNMAKIGRREALWYRYINRIQKLGAMPVSPPWERAYLAIVRRTYTGRYARFCGTDPIRQIPGKLAEQR